MRSRIEANAKSVLLGVTDPLSNIEISSNASRMLLMTCNGVRIFEQSACWSGAVDCLASRERYNVAACKGWRRS